jgi:hypothetical protein
VPEVVYVDRRRGAFLAAFGASLFLSVFALRRPEVAVVLLGFAGFLTLLAFVFFMRTTAIVLDAARGVAVLVVNRPFRNRRRECPLEGVAVVLKQSTGSPIRALWFRSGEDFRYLLLAGEERDVVPRAEALARRLGRFVRVEFDRSVG